MSKLDALRTIANIETLKWASLEKSDEWQPEDNVWWYNLSYDSIIGEGSYLYKMGAGASSNPHEHKGPEEFFVLEGDLIDSDGFEYKKGDFVSFEPGSKHSSHTINGCLVLVFMRGINQPL